MPAEWSDADTVAVRVAAEIRADPDIFIIEVADHVARNPFDDL